MKAAAALSRHVLLVSVATLLVVTCDRSPTSSDQFTRPRFATNPPPSPTSVYLHGSGGTANPPTLSMDAIPPTATTAKYQDSPGVKFGGGNPWVAVGTWTVSSGPVVGSLTAFSSVHIWLGLRNSDDVGTRFDILVEAFRNGALLVSGQLMCIQGLTASPGSATEVSIPFGSFAPAAFNGTSDLLSLKLSTRIGTSAAGGLCGGHSNAVGLRSYFDATNRAAHCDATLGSGGIVGSPGGSVASADGRLTLLVPSGALAQNTSITVSSSSGPLVRGLLAGSVYDLGPSGTTFSNPVTLTIRYDPSHIPTGIHESSVKLYQNSGNGWKRVPGSISNTTDHTVSGLVSHFSGGGAGVPVASVTVTPNTASVPTGSTAHFTATTKDSAGDTLTDRVIAWASSNPSLATVDDTGLVAAVATGQVTITATAEGVSGSAALDVVAVTTNLVVTSLADDDSPGTLRQVLATAPSGTRIIFADDLAPAGGNATILLRCADLCLSREPGALRIETNVEIKGPTLYHLILHGPSPTYSPQFDYITGNGVLLVGFHSQPTVAISDVTIMGGSEFLDGGNGGGITNFGTLTLTSVTVTGNNGGNDAGGILNEGGTLKLTNSTVTGNRAFDVGGIGNRENGSVTLINSAVDANNGSRVGGIRNLGTLTLDNTTVSGNIGGPGPGGIVVDAGTLALTNGSSVCNNTPLPNIFLVGGAESGTNTCPGSLAVNGGDNQIATVSTAVATSPSVVLTDQYNNPVSGVAVTFAVTSGGGVVDPVSAILTNAAGVAQVTSWTLGATPGANSLTATAAGGGIAGNPVTFSAKAVCCWTTLADMPKEQTFMGVGVIADTLYVVGGYDNNGFTAAVQTYDPVTNGWSSKASLPLHSGSGRGALGVGVVGGILYAVGGTDAGGLSATVEAYNPVTDTWIPMASMNTQHYCPGVGVIGNQLYAVGGQNTANGVIRTVEVYDPAANQWTTVDSMPTARQCLGVAAIGGTLYAVGGNPTPASCNFLATVEAYVPAMHAWSTRQSMFVAREGMGLVAVGGKLYAIGGANTSCAPSAAVEAYDPGSNTWSAQSDMPTARGHLGAAEIKGVIYAVGGSVFGTILRTVEAYRP